MLLLLGAISKSAITAKNYSALLSPVSIGKLKDVSNCACLLTGAMQVEALTDDFSLLSVAHS